MFHKSFPYELPPKGILQGPKLKRQDSTFQTNPKWEDYHIFDKYHVHILPMDMFIAKCNLRRVHGAVFIRYPRIDFLV